MPDPTSPRDELVALLAEHHAHLGPVSGRWSCACGVQSTNGTIRDSDLTSFGDRCDEYRAHLADVLLAAGWTKPEPPEVRVIAVGDSVVGASREQLDEFLARARAAGHPLPMPDSLTEGQR